MLSIIAFFSGLAFFIKIFYDGDQRGDGIYIDNKSWILLAICLLTCIISTIIYS